MFNHARSSLLTAAERLGDARPRNSFLLYISSVPPRLHWHGHGTHTAGEAARTRVALDACRRSSELATGGRGHPGRTQACISARRPDARCLSRLRCLRAGGAWCAATSLLTPTAREPARPCMCHRPCSFSHVDYSACVRHMRTPRDALGCPIFNANCCRNTDTPVILLLPHGSPRLAFPLTIIACAQPR